MIIFPIKLIIIALILSINPSNNLENAIPIMIFTFRINIHDK